MPKFSFNSSCNFSLCLKYLSLSKLSSYILNQQESLFLSLVCQNLKFSLSQFCQNLIFFLIYHNFFLSNPLESIFLSQVCQNLSSFSLSILNCIQQTLSEFQPQNLILFVILSSLSKPLSLFLICQDPSFSFLSITLVFHPLFLSLIYQNLTSFSLSLCLHID